MSTLFVALVEKDICTGHDACKSRIALEGSPDVFIDGKPVVRVGDRWEMHGCPAHPAHNGVVTQGSDEVSLNGMPVARIGDPLNCGSKVKTGTPAVYAGGKLSSITELNKKLPEMDEATRAKSEREAAAMKEEAQKHVELAKEMGAKTGTPPALWLGKASRETNFGKALDSKGYGDHGHGFGMFQVDNRSHTPQGGPFSQQHYDQSAGIWNNQAAAVARKHPDWTSDEQLKGTVASYNFGVKNVQTRPSDAASWAQLDDGTAHDDYSRDVLGRAKWYADNLDWGD